MLADAWYALESYLADQEDKSPERYPKMSVRRVQHIVEKYRSVPGLRT